MTETPPPDPPWLIHSEVGGQNPELGGGMGLPPGIGGMSSEAGGVFADAGAIIGFSTDVAEFMLEFMQNVQNGVFRQLHATNTGGSALLGSQEMLSRHSQIVGRVMAELSELTGKTFQITQEAATGAAVEYLNADSVGSDAMAAIFDSPDKARMKYDEHGNLTPAGSGDPAKFEADKQAEAREQAKLQAEIDQIMRAKDAPVNSGNPAPGANAPHAPRGPGDAQGLGYRLPEFVDRRGAILPTLQPEQHFDPNLDLIVGHDDEAVELDMERAMKEGR